MTRTLLTAVFLTLFGQAAWAGLFDNYPIGKKGDVIAEQWSENRGEWDSVALFFGYLDDWTICEEYREMVKEKSGTKIRCVESR